MYKKEIIFIVLSAFFIVATSFYIKIGSYLLAIFFAILYLANVIFLAIIPSSRWIALFYPFFWLAFDYFIGTDMLFLLALGLPSAIAFINVKKNFFNRVKIDFIESVRPTLSLFFILCIFFISLFVATHFSEQEIKEFVKKSIPQNITLAGQKMPIATSLDKFVNEKFKMAVNPVLNHNMELFMTQCEGDADCEAKIKKEFENKFSQKFTNILSSEIEGNGQSPIDILFESLKEKLPFPLPILVGLLIFISLTPFSFMFSMILVLILRILFQFLKLINVFMLTRKTVEQEVIV